MKIVQINVSANKGSTGKIAEGIGQELIQNGHESVIAYGREANPSQSQLWPIGNKWDQLVHGLYTRILDRHAFASTKATQKLVRQIEEFNPDVIGLHNLHGYYINIEVLFRFLKQFKKPVIWTFHDCWPFTGHCAYYDSVNCQKWQSECHHCPKTKAYPASYGLDQSRKNFRDKKRLFNKLSNLNIITPSYWLANEVKKSFLKDWPVQVIHNGVDLETFKPKALNQEFSKTIILGVASTWDPRKGLNDFLHLANKLGDDYEIVLIGLSAKQLKKLPENVKGITRTENVGELVEWYNTAAVFVNPTYQDNFPTTNIEALACGTPVITYDTGGSPEAIDEETGKVVPKGDISGLKAAIDEIAQKGKAHYQPLCRARAEHHFNKEDRYQDYVHLFERMVSK